MENDKIVIPEGWTYFAHRTNTDKWDEDPFDSDKITIKKIMSVVTEKEIHEELEMYGKDHLQGYSTGQGEPFEIRCLICALPYLQSLDDNDEIKSAMLKEFYYDRRNIGGCYGQRHHSIPPEEELIILGIGTHDEVFDSDKKIIWTIPRRFLEFYKEEIENKKIRAIDTQEPDEKLDKKVNDDQTETKKTGNI